MSIAAVLSIGVMAAPAGGATAAPPAVSAMSLTMTPLSVTTSTKTRLKLELDASENSPAAVTDSAGSNSSSMDVDLNTKGLNEIHDWSFPLPTGAFSEPTPGNGVLDAGTSIAPFGIVNLTFAPAGDPVRATCDANDYTVSVPVALKGRLRFNTRSTGKHAWGSVGSTAARFVAKGTVVTTYGDEFFQCFKPSSPCAASTGWSASDDAVTFFGGVVVAKGKNTGFIDANRTVELAAPLGATRSDTVAVASPAPTLKKKSGGMASMSVTTSGGRGTGSASLRSNSAATSSSLPCGSNKTESFTDWPSTYHAGPPPLRLSEQVFGALTVADATNADITVITA